MILFSTITQDGAAGRPSPRPQPHGAPLRHRRLHLGEPREATSDTLREATRDTPREATRNMPCTAPRIYEHQPGAPRDTPRHHEHGDGPAADPRHARDPGHTRHHRRSGG